MTTHPEAITALTLAQQALLPGDADVAFYQEVFWARGCCTRARALAAPRASPGSTPHALTSPLCWRAGGRAFVQRVVAQNTFYQRRVGFNITWMSLWPHGR